MKETWNKIDGVHGEYFISNIGRVESRNLRRCFMKPTITPNGYLRVNLGFGGITQNRMIHRLVAMSFCKGYSEGKQVNHIDCNKFNNSPSNLEWVTAKENTTHAREMGLYHSGEKHGCSKLSNAEVLLIREWKKGLNMSTKMLAECFKVTTEMISNICARRNWRHI